MSLSPIQRFSRLAPAALGLGLLAACSGGSDSTPPVDDVIPAALVEQEPNDAAGQAQNLSMGRTGYGDVLTAGDVDFWSVNLSAGQTVSIEVFGTRFNQAAWDNDVIAVGGPTTNVPRLTIWNTDGTSKLLEHDHGGFTSDGWSWGSHDLDIPMFRAPASGTYFVSVTQDDQLNAGGAYAVRVVNTDVPGFQYEIEDGAEGTNDTFATAQPINPGTLYGFHVDNESDWYSFEITTPAILRFTMTSYRNGVAYGDDAYFDTYMYLYAPDGSTVIAGNDDSFYYDSALQGCLETPGTYFIRVTECCGSGDANYFLRFERINATPTVLESEPNDTTGTPDMAAYGDRVEGTTDVGDTDFFAFTATAGDMVFLTRYDAGNCEGADDEANCDLMDTDGTTVLNTGGDNTLQTSSTMITASGTYYVRVTPSGTSTKYIFELNRFSAAQFESEPNDTSVEADTLDSNGCAAGVINAPGESDVFSFTADAGEFVNFVIYASNSPTSSDGFWNFSGWGSDLYPKLLITDSDSTPLAFSDSEPMNGIYTESVVNGLATASVAFVATEAGTYFVTVTGPLALPGISTDTWTYAVHKR